MKRECIDLNVLVLTNHKSISITYTQHMKATKWHHRQQHTCQMNRFVTLFRQLLPIPIIWMYLEMSHHRWNLFHHVVTLLKFIEDLQFSPLILKRCMKRCGNTVAFEPYTNQRFILGECRFKNLLLRFSNQADFLWK